MLLKWSSNFFIQGLTDKQWLKDRNCHIWNEWHNPQSNDDNDLGPIYGYQWRNFGGYSPANDDSKKNDLHQHSTGCDQLKQLVEQLKSNPNDRRMLVSAWNPLDLPFMALPPCHVLFHLVALDGKLNLTWFQRSCDLMLGIPFNLASYSLLLHLLAKESNLKTGKVIGMLSDVHIYENHLEQAKKQLKNKPLPLPEIQTEPFTNIFAWKHSDTKLINYQSHDKIVYPIAI